MIEGAQFAAGALDEHPKHSTLRLHICKLEC